MSERAGVPPHDVRNADVLNVWLVVMAASQMSFRAAVQGQLASA